MVTRKLWKELGWGVLRSGRTHRCRGNIERDSPPDYTSPANRGQEDIEIMYGIISRTSCSENKALEKRASWKDAAKTMVTGAPASPIIFILSI